MAAAKAMERAQDRDEQRLGGTRDRLNSSSF
jgi:hypothetical protein